MNRDVAISRLRDLEPRLRAAGLSALYLFGSFARDGSGAESDMDLAFEVDAVSRFSLLDQARLQIDLTEALDRHVDLVAREGLHRSVAKHAERDMIRIF